MRCCSRNGTLRGQGIHLNMGGFLYTNRQSLSIGLVLPVDNLRQHWGGDPNLLMEWFLRLPALQPWFAEAKQGPFGAKIIRGGGAKDVPNLIDDGLAIGGAASAVGLDFPYPNFTGPATAMGLLITQAARKIRDEGGTYTRDRTSAPLLETVAPNALLARRGVFASLAWLCQENLGVFQQQHRRRPGQRLPLDAAGHRPLEKMVAPGKGLDRWRSAALKWKRMQLIFRKRCDTREAAPLPSPWRLLLDGALNTFRDLLGEPRAFAAARRHRTALHHRRRRRTRRSAPQRCSGIGLPIRSRR